MKRFLLILLFIGIFTSKAEAQCSITTSTNASTLTCGTSPLTACNGILNIGNGSTPITFNMNSALDLSCLGPIQVIVNNATIYFQSGNNRLTLAEGSSITFINGATLSDVSCNASERIYIGANLLASCNGGASADLKFEDLVNQGGTGSATSNSPVCSGNTIILSATPPPVGTYTYAWSGPGGLNTSYGSSSTYSFTATASSGGTYTAKMKSSSGTIIEMLITVTVNSGASTAAPTVSLTNPNCSVATGSISITAPVGSGIKYSIDGITYTNTSGVFNSVSAGTYNVTAKNSSGCISPITTSTVAQVTNTWNGTSWSAGTPPTIAQKIVFSGDYSSSSDITGCSCHVTSGNVVFTSGTTLSVTNEVKVTAGSLSFDDTASLVQTNDAAVNTGSITYKRQTSPLKLYDYTYWSSPVANATLSQLATNSLCFSFSPSTNNWVYQATSASMTPGVGYIGRTPDPLLSATLQTSFVGVPNNGVVNVSIVKSTGAYNLIGNPYPSAIDVDLFLTDATNSTVVNGTVYFWTHNTSITNNNYTINDYAKYNFTGGVRTSTAALSGGILPTGKIGAGQGFFIEANTAKANGTYSASFKNAMRVTNTNTQFFRNSNTAATASVSGNLERHRLWLSLTDVQGAYNQMLLGYVAGATNDFDTMFDGKTMPVGNPVAIYTMVGDYDLSIQGKSLPFSENDVIPIGYSTTTNGTLTISLENFDGLFETQNIYMLDKVTGIYHDIKAGDFTFTTTSGTFEDRFELHFTNTALGTVVPNFNAAVVVLTNQHQLTVLCDASPITKVEVFDLLGKQIFSQSGLNTTNFQTENLTVGTQALLVKITLENDITVIKKTLMN